MPNDLDWEIIFNSGINITEYQILSLFDKGQKTITDAGTRTFEYDSDKLD